MKGSHLKNTATQDKYCYTSVKVKRVMNNWAKGNYPKIHYCYPNALNVVRLP